MSNTAFEPTPAAEPSAKTTASLRLARTVTEIFAPWVLITLLPIGVAWQATGYRWWPALGWGVLVAATSALIPQAVMTVGAARGRWDGHHVRDRAGRLIPFIALIGSGAIGLVLLVTGGAPRAMTALDAGMLALVIVAGAITTKWKISMHAAAGGGATVVLALFYGPAWWLLGLVTAGIGWSRVRLGDHTTAQVVAGALAGALIIGGGFAVLA
ncbi:hypothetical protein INP57_04535 [Saccharopolyspora sp. HNM0986]|uniref:phosphatase PAP2 family protein n=1 Tax=Saccharopolyspora galaxeae TaxID=2781241 RepID=UPI00190C94CF|nr:phosphatase PAP2 family protein [Saccharopolyspora sp. HNM0986]MBK0866068.1 hypothetical protein [Saccharopolyspora sp. HNM0986]